MWTMWVSNRENYGLLVDYPFVDILWIMWTHFQKPFLQWVWWSVNSVQNDLVLFTSKLSTVFLRLFIIFNRQDPVDKSRNIIRQCYLGGNLDEPIE